MEDSSNKFVNNFSIYGERSDTLIREINKSDFVNGKARSDIYTTTNQVKENLLFIKDKISLLSETIISLSNQLIEEINSAINDYLKLQNKNENNAEFLIRRLDELSHRSEIIKTNIIFSSQPINENKYKEELESFKIKSQKDVDEIKSMRDNIGAELNALKETVEKFKETNKADTENLELKANAIDFEKIGNDYNAQAIKWRNYVVVLVLLVISISISFMYCFNNINIMTVNGSLTGENRNTLFYFVLIKNATLRVFILSVLIYLLRFCIKNYNALKHNSTINKHKANCFSAAIRINTLYPQEDKVRESILTLAGKEIFTHHRTGYLYKDEKIDLSVIEKLISIGEKTDKA